MKKVISLVSALLATVCLLTACSTAQTSLKYEKDGGGYYNVIGLGNVQGPKVVIPETYNDLPVSGVCYYTMSASTLYYSSDSSLEEKDIKELDARYIDYFGLGCLKGLTGLETLYISSLYAQESGNSPEYRLFYLFETKETGTNGLEARKSLKTLIYSPKKENSSTNVGNKFSGFDNLTTVVIKNYCPVLKEKDFYNLDLNDLYLPKEIEGLENYVLYATTVNDSRSFVIHYEGTQEEWDAIPKEEYWDYTDSKSQANYTIEFSSVYEG